ncbi:MAG: hypothetical protein IH609_05560, partial [Dehalococcoidia bacterium]|nr:hypothetical protein [Dehalococcoidia bacterium]
MWKRRIFIGLAGSSVAVFGGIAAACSSDGVSQSDYDKVQQELKDQQAQNEQLKLQAQSSPTAAASPAASATADPSGVTLLIGAVKKAAAPTPTPLPAGTTPPPAPAR